MSTSPQSPSVTDLPTPSPEAVELSERLQAFIHQQIDDAGGAIPFSQYMELALYSAGMGYYSAGSSKLGAEGDFVTAPELSPLFSRCLARQCAEILQDLEQGDILEFGAGSGVMAADILQELEELGQWPGHYFILELSADLRERQQQTLQQRQPKLMERIHWLDALPERFSGVVLANEVLDAMPVELFEIRDDAPMQVVVQEAEDRFVESLRTPIDSVLTGRLQSLQKEHHLDEGYRSELNLRAEQWLQSLSGVLQEGVVLLIDYGFPAHEFYHPQRNRGTLMCHYRHRAHDDPYHQPGLEDITAHVDFTAIAEAAQANRLDVLGFANQANFLLATGLTEMVQETGDEKDTFNRNYQIRRLTQPAEMGEIFKVMALGRGWTHPLRGFALRDDRFRL